MEKLNDIQKEFQILNNLYIYTYIYIYIYIYNWKGINYPSKINIGKRLKKIIQQLPLIF